MLHYPVSAVTIDGLKRDLRRNGHKGFAGFTKWEVHWTPNCKVSVNITYILPEHTRPQMMPERVRRRFTRMLANLVAHENKHGRHAILAGREIEKAGCRNARRIIRKYNAADATLDRRTRHDRRDGVTLD
ncbi:DUF922 domain-containing protein [Sulfitobacter sp. F26204]|uniref:DUF922 domain-containing protein n=1 Tax=Sulfitobacter sp. F26204 TaxID=2996014 RepID=UPI00225DFAA9|nr:DUF922 domain-containing protein [Sulfitobacter sp. F26204]MCX7558219.1 DUF922 domain-containing protein [Sulfitobacter sp. F26204]